MTTTEILTWYGGYVGVTWNADRRLHLLDDNFVTFCKITTGLTPVTQREANRLSFCQTCNERAQAERRDVA